MLLDMTMAMSFVDQFVREQVVPRVDELRSARSARELRRTSIWRELRWGVEEALGTVEHQDAGTSAGAQPFYRIVAWNIQRGLAYDGVLRHLREDPLLARADVLLLTEVDKGMARSDNRHVARELAQAVGMQWAFVPCYFNLTKGLRHERLAAGQNALGLHGNAILSRYPLSRFRVHSLPNGRDKIATAEKRLGEERALTATVALPDLALSVTCIHLDAHCSRRHREMQMRLILSQTADIAGPRVLGGDWNTTTYDAQSVVAALLNVVGRRGGNPERVDHLPPQRRFERRLFEALRSEGFDWESCNPPGVATWHYDACLDGGAGDATGGWLPGWAPRMIDFALRRRGGQCSFKLDWFATRDVCCAGSFAVSNLSHRGMRVSDHDPIVVDVRPS
jgi:endonuclease/exonuclease/phosphatase family metal-dependent hydrolase